MLRPPLAADLEPTVAAVRDGGWGERRPELEFYFRHAQCHPIVAEAYGAIVGTAMATYSGRVGWLGLVFVTPALRGRGLGAALTRAALDTLAGFGCRTVLLAASDLGKPLYDRIGFVVDGAYTVWNDPGAVPRTHTDSSLRRLTAEDVLG